MSFTVTFGIRETTYYTGHVTIDPVKWLEVMASPFHPEEFTDDQISQYVAKTGADVEERDAYIDGQEWFDLEIEEARA